MLDKGALKLDIYGFLPKIDDSNVHGIMARLRYLSTFARGRAPYTMFTEMLSSNVPRSAGKELRRKIIERLNRLMKMGAFEFVIKMTYGQVETSRLVMSSF